MSEEQRIGPESDLTAKQILINIPDDQQFVAACRTNKKMQELCAHEDVWEERLKKYYPDYVSLKKLYKISWRKLYPLVSLISELKKTFQDGHDLDKPYSWEKLDTPSSKIEDRIAQYFVSNDLYDLILIIFSRKDNWRFRLSEYDRRNIYTNILYRIIGKFIQSNDKRIVNIVDKLGSSQLINNRSFQELLAYYGSADFILEIIDKNSNEYDIASFYTNNVNSFTPRKAKDFIEKAYQIYSDLDQELLLILSDAIDYGHFGLADFIVKNYDRDTISTFLTDILIRNNHDHDDFSRQISYMIGRKIRPDYVALFSASIANNTILNIIKSFVAGNIYPDESDLVILNRRFSDIEIYEDIIKLIDQ